MLRGYCGEGEQLAVCAYLARVTTGQASVCMACGVHLQLLLITPCGHLVCAMCVDKETHACAICHKDFDVDYFQRLQPGCELQWLAAQPPPTPHSAPTPGEAGVAGGGGLQLAQLSVDELAANTKAAHVIRVLDATRIEDAAGKAQTGLGPGMAAWVQPRRRPPKILVFSQFRPVLNLVGDVLLRRYGVEAVAEYWGKHRVPELSKFTHSQHCFVMLLGKDGAVGLDLSFVTHIFLMDQAQLLTLSALAHCQHAT
jgi:hypothetical protein